MHRQPSTDGTTEQRPSNSEVGSPSLPDDLEDQARANAMVAFMVSGTLQFMHSLVVFDGCLHRTVGEAYARALQVMVDERKRYAALRARRLKDAASAPGRRA